MSGLQVSSVLCTHCGVVTLWQRHTHDVLHHLPLLSLSGPGTLPEFLCLFLFELEVVRSLFFSSS